MLTPDMAREAFQSAIPNRRDAFEHAAKKCARDASHQNFIQQYYATEIMQLAKHELRFRLNMASERVKQLIDSGWIPSDVQSARSVYADLFSKYNNWNRDPITDLVDVIENGLTLLGVAEGRAPTKDQQNRFVLEFSHYQVEVFTEFVHDVEFYMATKDPGNANVTNLTLQGNINYLQTGGTAHVTQNIGIDSEQVVRALKALRASLDASDEPHVDELRSLVDSALTESKNPNVSWAVLSKSLDGFQNLVRTTGAVPAAWNLFASLGNSHGLHLPMLP